ncbi:MULTISPECIES: hypothetical protein [Metallibacterium]|jgi:regulator of protease activity HflC (stomatin/prohibitin superfamily)|uniref:hypothetical protein n=1 Tax=Metallibacterium TaxID=1218803 RepID=UPI0026134A87|nr:MULTISPECIES: hypothetical protein [Metallibacterium]MBW8073824.1 hypothetical protein [Metallibacterium scheffleri]
MSVALLALLAATVVLVALTVKRVPEGTVITLRRIDGHARRLEPGTHFVLPLLERVNHRISLGGHVLQLAAPEVSGRLYWQVLEPARAEGVIERAEALLSQTAFEVVVAQRGASCAQMKASINQRLRDFGLLVTRLDLAAA